MQTHLLADELGLHDVAHDQHDDVQQRDAHGHAEFAQHGGDDGPGNEHRAGAQNRHDVDDGNQHRQTHGVRNPKQQKADAQLEEGQAHDEDVRDENLADRGDTGGDRRGDGRLEAGGQLALDVADDVIEIQRDEAGGDDGHNHGEDGRGHAGDDAGGKAHGEHGDAGDQVFQIGEQRTADPIDDVHNGGIKLLHLHFQRVKGIGDERHNLRGIQQRNLRKEMLQRGDDLQSGHRHGDEQDAVKHDRQQKGGNAAGQMEPAGDGFGRLLQEPGDEKAKDERTQRTEQILHKEPGSDEQHAVKRCLDQESFLFFNGHVHPPLPACTGIVYLTIITGI